VSQQTFNELLVKQKHNIDTEEDKLMIEKEIYKRSLGLDKLNEEVLKAYYRKTSSIKNFFHLLHDDTMFEGNTQHVDDCNSKLDIVRKLIKGPFVFSLSLSRGRIYSVGKSILPPRKRMRKPPRRSKISGKIVVLTEYFLSDVIIPFCQKRVAPV
jgi:hypothetical protein